LTHPPLPVYLDQAREEELAQGDLLESLEFFHPQQGEYRDVVRAPGVVMSHGCDFTKFRADEARGFSRLDRFPLLIAPLLGEEELLDPGVVGHAKGGRVARYLHLPPDGPLSDRHHFIDFWFIQPAAVFELLAINRLASMTDTWQLYLQRGLDRFFSWEDRRRPIWEES
jgi:hypothetical protein